MPIDDHLIMSGKGMLNEYVTHSFGKLDEGCESFCAKSPVQQDV